MSPPDALRKGWCPGALRPMAAEDGLLVRLRLTGGIVPAATARALATCAERHGNGLFDLSARGNLQMRGVGEARLPSLLDDLRALALLDADADGEAVRNVVASPLAGCHDVDHRGSGSLLHRLRRSPSPTIRAGDAPDASPISEWALDIRPITAALERRLAGDPALHALPGKFGFLIDDGGSPSLAGVAADVRFDWCARDERFAIGLGGSRTSAVTIATCRAADLVESAARVAAGALRLFVESSARRMRHLIADFGADVVARACGGETRASPFPHAAEMLEIVGQNTFGGTPTLGLAAPFGRLDAAMLRHTADLADLGSGEIRLTPWRTILLPGLVAETLVTANRAGFIVEDRDPRRAVAACVGQNGCVRGTTATHADAAALAATAASLAGNGVTLHVSGCEKGCAKPSATAVTLVGRDGRYDLVRDGRAADAPLARGLDIDAARATIAALPVSA